jgi:hypothetical protein
MLMTIDSYVLVHGVGTFDLKLTSRQIVQSKKMQHVPTIHNYFVTMYNGLKLAF